LNRVAWTDDRIDDAMSRIDRGFESLRDEMREMRMELRDMRGEMREMRTDLQGQISAGQRQMTTIGWGIAAALLAQLIAFVVTQS
jgi:ABC-type branched-subunit amino acid transport system ATPase component